MIRCDIEPRCESGFGEKNLRRMVQFARVFPEAEIVRRTSATMMCAHFKLLIPLKD